MPSLPFLAHTLPLYDQHLASFHREERRLYGGDAVLEELLQWKGETATDWEARKATAGYITLPKLHATTLTGHLSGQTPMPNFAELGEVRELSEVTDMTRAEMLWYNVDGIGQDGNEMIPWFDGVQERAMATGYRWILVEKPSMATLRNIRESNKRSPDGVVTGQDEQQGFRPYPVEYPPSAVPFWQITNGRLDFAVIKIPIVPENLVDDSNNLTGSDEGFYLLVRRGFRGLGAAYAAGGWWKFDRNQDPIIDADGQPETGTWEQTLGQVPLFMFVGEPSTGTAERPALARSLTMELGQIAVSLMTLRSARDYNIVQAAKSINYVLGINPGEHAKVVEQAEAGGIMVGVPPVMLQDGTVGIPTMWNSSAAALDAPVFESVIRSSLDEAREIMVKQVTSTPTSSGESKKAGFAEATSPLLARLAATRQQAINTFLYFASLRFGIPNPTASVTIPREFDLAPVVDEIDNALSRLKRSWLRSPTWEIDLLMRSGDETGTLPEDKVTRDKIRAELEASATPTQPADLLVDDLPGTPGRTGVTPAAPATPPGTPAPTPAPGKVAA